VSSLNDPTLIPSLSTRVSQGENLGFTYGTYVFPMIYVLYPYFILTVFLGSFIRILILLFGKMELENPLRIF